MRAASCVTPEDGAPQRDLRDVEHLSLLCDPEGNSLELSQEAMFTRTALYGVARTTRCLGGAQCELEVNNQDLENKGSRILVIL